MEDLVIMARNINSIDIKKPLEEKDFTIVSKIIDHCNSTPLSLATKICHYVCRSLLDGDSKDNFPIFDNVIRNNLCKYSDKWKNKTVGDKKNSKHYYTLTPQELRNKTYGVDITEFYKFYVECISDLAEKNKVSKTGVEKLIWYYHNGE